MRRIVTDFGDRNMEWAVFFGGQVDMFVKICDNASYCYWFVRQKQATGSTFWRTDRHICKDM